MKKFLLLLLLVPFLLGIQIAHAQDVTPTLYCLGSCPTSTEIVSQAPTSAPTASVSPSQSSETSTTPTSTEEVSVSPTFAASPSGTASNSGTTAICTNLSHFFATLSMSQVNTKVHVKCGSQKQQQPGGYNGGYFSKFIALLLQFILQLLQLCLNQSPTAPTPIPAVSPSVLPSTGTPIPTTSISPVSSVSPEPTTAGDTTSTLCKTIPSTPGVKPIATNTGVPSGITLTTNPPAGVQVSGDSWKVTSDGTIIDSKAIENKWVDIEAKNVTIKNSRIKAPDGVYWAVGNSNTTSGLKIYASEVYTTNGAHNGMIVGSDSVVCGVNAHGFENIAVVEGTNIIMQSNYFHINKGAPGYADPHDDGMEVRAGNNIKILGNNIKQTNQDESWQHNTSALYVGATYGDIDKVVIDGNWFGGGTYSLYTVTVKGQKSPTPVLKTLDITNNKWYRNSYEYGPHSSDDGSSWKAHTWSNNTFEDNGQSIAF